MDAYTIKPSIEPKDKYEKARQDVIQTAKSVQELSPNQRQKLVQEIFGYEVVIKMCKFMQQINED